MASDDLVNIGLILLLASFLLFQVQLVLFRNFLKSKCPQIWEAHVTNSGRANFLTRYHKLKTLPLIYASDNPIIDRKLRSLAIAYKSGIIGVSLMAAGGLWDAMNG